MNPSLLFDLVLAFGVTFLEAQGEDEVALTLRKLSTAKQSGVDIDAHMQKVADALLSGEPLEWDALNVEIDAEVARFLS